MSYDLTGLSMLWRHRNHPWVRAQARRLESGGAGPVVRTDGGSMGSGEARDGKREYKEAPSYWDKSCSFFALCALANFRESIDYLQSRA